MGVTSQFNSTGAVRSYYGQNSGQGARDGEEVPGKGLSVTGPGWCMAAARPSSRSVNVNASLTVGTDPERRLAITGQRHTRTYPPTPPPLPLLSDVGWRFNFDLCRLNDLIWFTQLRRNEPR